MSQGALKSSIKPILGSYDLWNSGIAISISDLGARFAKRTLFVSIHRTAATFE